MKFRNRCAVLCVGLTTAICGFGQQQQQTDLAQLKAKLQQLEDMMKDLQKQIAEAETKPGPPAQPLVPPSPKAVVVQPAAPQLPTDNISELTRTRVVANNDPAGAARIDNEEIDPTLRGFFRLPGTSTLIKFSGFVKTDVFVDANKAGSYYGAYVPSSFPSSPQPHTVDSTVSMRPSRFSVEFRQPLQDPSDPNDTVKAYLEYDFLGDYDRNSLRLRQFYAQYKNLLVGQTWSSFGDPDVFPDTLEFEGPPGIMGLRQPMIRYTQPLGTANSVGVSVEKSGTDVPFSTQFGTPQASQTRPDLIAFYRYQNAHGHLYFAGVSRSLGGTIPNTNIPDLRNHVNGYGFSISGLWGTTKNNIVFQGIGGKGISNYYNDNFGLGSDVGFDASGHLVATPTWSTIAGFQHHWTSILRSTVSYGYLRINNTAMDPGTNYHWSNYATVNLIVQPRVNLLYGIEYIYGDVVRKDGFKWIAPRFQASVTYYINKYPLEQ